MNDKQLYEVLLRLDAAPTISVDDFALLVGIGRSTAYAAIAAGEVPSVRVGRRVRVPSAWVQSQLHRDGRQSDSQSVDRS
ncbi:excisionase family DNA-binding protein [Nocardia bhagyanarayanae]|uniref:excisionase family DNA-binding protein n=1 Tax=Nocardia bhagyanarayanae TaxID=1215925 RepID=UPI00163B5323|nr:excisionase family DNA-binding protein [Nocardia bhagyanarayanae]